MVKKAWLWGIAATYLPQGKSRALEQLTIWSFFDRLFQLRPCGEMDITLGFEPSVSGSPRTNLQNILSS